MSGATCVSDRQVILQLGNPRAQNPNVTQCCFKKEERRPVDLIIALTEPILIVILHSNTFKFNQKIQIDVQFAQ